MARFLALLYVPSWLSAPQPADAPANDAELVNRLQAYRQVDSDVACAALKVMRRHVWYLAPETAALALCSSRTSNEVKGAMAERLLETPRPEEHVVGGNTTVVLDDDEMVRLPDLIGEDSWLVFNMLEHKGEWLRDSPENWMEHEEYRQMCSTVSALNVVNDTAERGVQLIQQFAGRITKEETDLQWLLQCVEAHRKNIPTLSKGALHKL